MTNMKARELIRRRADIAENAFADIVVWRVSQPVPGSHHLFKYRLALVVDGECVLRFDNETGKGNHRHRGQHEESYPFSSPRQLLTDFFDEIERWKHEHGNS
jgi:hypothetical protein